VLHVTNLSEQKVDAPIEDSNVSNIAIQGTFALFLVEQEGAEGGEGSLIARRGGTFVGVSAVVGVFGGGLMLEEGGDIGEFLRAEGTLVEAGRGSGEGGEIGRPGDAGPPQEHLARVVRLHRLVNHPLVHPRHTAP